MIKTTITIERKYTFEGTDLAKERERLGLTQSQLAGKSGIAQQHISGYEAPGPRTIRETTYYALIKAGIDFNGI